MQKKSHCDLIVYSKTKREVPFEQNLYVEYIIDSLPYVPYEVRVSARNIIGEGPKSEIKIVHTAEGSKWNLLMNVSNHYFDADFLF